MVRVVTKKYGCQYWSTKQILYKVQYFRRLMIDFQLYFIWISKNNHKYRIFAVFTYLNYHSSQTKKHGNENLQRASWYLHQILKQHIQIRYVPNQLVKNLWTVYPYLVLQHVKVSMSSACLSWHVQLLYPPTQMSKN